MKPTLNFLLMVHLFASANALAASTQAFVVGESLPNTFLSGLNGASRDLADFRGYPLIINVWASWCGPCRAEMASLERLAWTEGLGDFTIIGVSTDDSRAKAVGWLNATNATIPHFIDRGLALESMLGASRIPLTVFVDANGLILQKVHGARAWDSPESIALLKLLFESKGLSSDPR